MKKNLIRNSILLVAVLFASSAFAQNWVDMMNDPNTNFYEVQKAFNTYYAKREVQLERQKRRMERKTGQPVPEGTMEVPGFEQFKRWEWFMKPRVGVNGERFSPDAVWNAMTEYKKGYDKPMAGTWTSLGPNTNAGIPGIGRINAVRVHPTNPSTIFICAPAGGLWKSTDDGVTWSTNTDQLQVIGCSDLAFDPTNPNTMYLATSDNDGGDTYSVGLLKSTDGGTTWNPTGLSFSLSGFVQIAKVLVDPTTPNNVVVATSIGLYRSTNGGTTFTKGINTATPGVAVAGAFKDMEFKPGAPSTVYACGTEFFRSTDGGANWTKATGSLPAATALQRMSIGVTAADVNAVYLVAMKATTYDMDGVYKSTNSGSSFGAKISTPNIGNQGFYDLCIAANPTNASEVMLGGQTVFMKSTDGGVNWTNTIGTMHVDFHDVIYTNGTTLYVTSDGGVWKSTNNGGSWTNKSSGLAISQIYGFGQSANTASLILGGWQDNGTNYYNGSTWGNAMGGDGMLAFVSKGSDQNMWGSQYNGTLNRSSTGVGGFSQMTGITETCPWVTEWNEDPTAFGTVYAGCANVWKATGSSFTKLGNVAGTSTVTITALAVSPANTQIMWCAKGTTLYKSTNGGTAWTAVSGIPIGSITDIQCHPTDANKCWITYSGFSNVNKVFQTTNGTTWTNISSSLPNIPVNCITIDKNGNDALYIGTDIGVFFKDASMSVWQPFSGGLPRVSVSQLDMFYPGNKLRASTYGRGMWESGLYQPGTYLPDANFAGSVLVGCPGLGVQFSDYTAGQPTSWNWTFQGGNPATSTAQNPFVAYQAPGTYSVSLTASNGNGTDSQSYTSYITIVSAQAAPTALGKIMCGPATVTLTATPSAPGTIHWWNAPAGGSMLATGNTYSPLVNGTTTFYVDESFATGNIDIVGATDNTMGAGAVFTANDIRGLYFDVLKPVKINTVKVYANTAAVRTIEIVDANGNWVTDTTLNIAASGTVTPTTVTINRTVYPGTNYMMKFRGTVDCFRNNAGAAYPYTDAGSNALTITNSNAGSPGYYYFFYDWQFTNIVCNTGRTAVVVTDTCSLTGINDLFVNNQLDIFPNPNNGQFTASFHTENIDNYTVKVTNAIGQTVYEEKLDNFSGTYSNKIDITSFRKGVYMLSVSNSKHETVKKVLVY
jgi:PKD repeat protein